jgi:Ca-activated chloride channel family protein
MESGMIELGNVILLRPQWLLALPVVVFVAFWSIRGAARLSGWDRAIDPPLLAALQQLGRVLPGTPRRNFLPALAAGLITLALAGPARQAGDASTFRNLDGLVVVMDLSRSVAEGGRLPQARAAARLLVERAGSRPVGLIVYAGDAYVASPLTTDLRALGAAIAALDGETVPDLGSRPERALALARRVLTESRTITGDIVLISDGGGDVEDALSEAASLKAAGGRISTAYVEAMATPEGMPAPGRALMEKVARAGGGVTCDVLDPVGLVEAIGWRPASRLARSDLALLLWTDYGRYLLALALLPALGLFRRVSP